MLNSSGHPVETISGPSIDGPWDMTSVCEGASSTLLSPTCSTAPWKRRMPIDEGTVVRIRLNIRQNRAPRVTRRGVATDFPSAPTRRPWW